MTTSFLNDIRKIRREFAELTVEEVRTIYEKIGTVLEEKEQAEAEYLAEQEQKEAKKAEVLKIMQEQGLDISDFISDVPKAKAKQKVEAKYEFLDRDGNLKTWSGRGRTPRDLQTLLDSGANISDFEIKSESENTE